MRRTGLVVVGSLLLLSGCSVFLASRGKDLTGLKTRDEVHAALGQPTVSGVAEGGSFEEYHTSQKISERLTERVSEGYPLALIVTCGAAELYLFPKELYELGSNALSGQTVRITYDTTGKVVGEYLDGESLAVFDYANDPIGPHSPASPSSGQSTAVPPPQPVVLPPLMPTPARQ